MVRIDDSSYREPYTYQWFINAFEKAKERTIEFCQPITHEQFLRRPAEDVWCIGECYSHLNSFGKQYLKRIHKGVDQASVYTGNEENPAFKPRLVWKGVIKFFAPPYKMKMKTVRSFSPELKANLKKEEVLEKFLNLQDQFIEALKKAEIELLDLAGSKVTNPLLTFIKMTPAECFSVVEVHQRRHMWQAEQILKRISP